MPIKRNQPVSLIIAALVWGTACGCWWGPAVAVAQFVQPPVTREATSGAPVRRQPVDPVVVNDRHVQAADFREPSGLVPSAPQAPKVGQDSPWSLVPARIRGDLMSMDWQRMAASLAIVIGGYLALVWVIRLAHPEQSRRRLPPEVVHIIGQTPFGNQRQLQLVRLGRKLVLLLVGPHGTQPIGEVTDPEEVEHLVGLCDPKLRRQALRYSPPRKNAPMETAPNLEEFVRHLQKVLAKSTGGTEYEA